jgi:hypothetical protein
MDVGELDDRTEELEKLPNVNVSIRSFTLSIMLISGSVHQLQSECKSVSQRIVKQQANRKKLFQYVAVYFLKTSRAGLEFFRTKATLESYIAGFNSQSEFLKSNNWTQNAAVLEKFWASLKKSATIPRAVVEEAHVNPLCNVTRYI